MSDISFVADSPHVVAWQQKAAAFQPAQLDGVDAADPFSATSLEQAAAQCVARFGSFEAMTAADRTPYNRYIGQALITHYGGQWVELLGDAEQGEFGVHIPELEALIAPQVLLEQAFVDSMAWAEIAGS